MIGVELTGGAEGRDVPAHESRLSCLGRAGNPALALGQALGSVNSLASSIAQEEIDSCGCCWDLGWVGGAGASGFSKDCLSFGLVLGLAEVGRGRKWCESSAVWVNDGCVGRDF